MRNKFDHLSFVLRVLVQRFENNHLYLIIDKEIEVTVVVIDQISVKASNRPD
jgi:hypothetical protein